MFLLDNRTLLFAQIFVGAIAAIYSFFPPQGAHKKVINSYRVANISYLLGFSLLLFQGPLPPLFTIIVSNTGIYLGFSFIALTALYLHKLSLKKYIIPILIIIHLGLFVFFTYINGNTFIRIIIISTEIALVLGFSVFYLIRQSRQKGNQIFKMLVITLNSYILLLIFRIIMTALFNAKIESIFSPDIASSIIFIGSIAFHLSMNLLIIISLILRYDEEAKERIKLLEMTHKEMTDLNSLPISTSEKGGQEKLYAGITSFIRTYFHAEAVGIYVKDVHEDYLNLVYIIGFPAKFEDAIKRLPIDSETITGKSVIESRPLIQNLDYYPDTSLKEILLNNGYTDIASYPIHTSLGSYGAFTMVFSDNSELARKESAFFHMLCHQMGIMMENAQLYESLNTKASTDPLTALPNRRELLLRFNQEIAKAKRYHRELSIVMLDIDHFKLVNDTYGHDMGDFILKDLSRIINDSLRKEDIFARYGGEEFVIVFPEIGISKLIDIGERIRKMIESHSFTFRKVSIKITISLGLSELKEADHEPSELITRADNCLYQAKKNGRNRVEAEKATK